MADLQFFFFFLPKTRAKSRADDLLTAKTVCWHIHDERVMQRETRSCTPSDFSRRPFPVVGSLGHMAVRRYARISKTGRRREVRIKTKSFVLPTIVHERTHASHLLTPDKKNKKHVVTAFSNRISCIIYCGAGELKVNCYCRTAWEETFRRYDCYYKQMYLFEAYGKKYGFNICRYMTEK